MSAISTTPSACGAPARGSDIIDLLLRNEGERLRLSELLDGLHERAFGIAMALLVLPNCLPMPGIPYMSTLTGVPILMLAAQLMLGRDEPWLPQRIARWGMSRDRLERLWRRVRPGVARVEHHLRPRLLRLTAPRPERVLAAVIALLAFILALPIPAGNLIPAWGILLLALGITERDGHVVIAGLIMSFAALCWIGLLAVAGSYLAGLAGEAWIWLRNALGL
jgi:hypothetical protein